MACTATSIMTESYEEPVMGTASSLAVRREDLRRRRHSSYHRRNWSMEDNIQVLVRAPNSLVRTVRAEINIESRSTDSSSSWNAVWTA